MNTPNKIIIHHSADTFAGDQFDKINQWHKEKWNFISSLGFYGGYQYLIEKSGTVRQYRSETEEGAHAKGQNVTSVGICLAGNFDIEFPNDAQKTSLKKLCQDIMKRWNISEIFPHRQFSQTSCYGSNLKDDWAKNLVVEQDLKTQIKNKILELNNLIEKL